MAKTKCPFTNVKWKVNGHSVILKGSRRKERACSYRPVEIMSPRPAKHPTKKSWPPPDAPCNGTDPRNSLWPTWPKKQEWFPPHSSRFGTKRGLLLAACSTAPGSIPQQFVAARAKYKSPMKTLIEVYVECSSFASTPESMVNGLAYLQNDLTDPQFRVITLAQFKAVRAETQ